MNGRLKIFLTELIIIKSDLYQYIHHRRGVIRADIAIKMKSANLTSVKPIRECESSALFNRMEILTNFRIDRRRFVRKHVKILGVETETSITDRLIRTIARFQRSNVVH